MEKYRKEIISKCLEDLLLLKIYRNECCFNNAEWELFKYLDENHYIIRRVPELNQYKNELYHRIHNLDYLITPLGFLEINMEKIKESQNIVEYEIEYCQLYDKLLYLSYRVVGSYDGYNKQRYPVMEDSYLCFQKMTYNIFQGCSDELVEKLVEKLHPFKNYSLDQNPKNETLINIVFTRYMSSKNLTRPNELKEEDIKNISGYLFGNGNSIKFLSNELKTAEFNKLLQKNKKILQVSTELQQYYNKLIYKDIGKENVIAFCLNEVFGFRCNEYCQTMLSNPNRYMLLFDYLLNKIKNGEQIQILENENAGYVGFEKLALISKLYYQNTEKYEQWIEVLRQEVFDIIKNIQDSNAINEIKNARVFFNSTIFTTNYDNVLERQLPSSSIVHLHGSIENNDIVIGGEYEDKVTAVHKLQFKKLEETSGVFAFVGFGLEFNDEHLLRTFRANKDITKFIYFQYDLFKMNEEDVNALKRKLSALLNNFKNPHRQIEIYDVSEFYRYYS